MTKIRVTFYEFEGGVEKRCVNMTSMVNTVLEVKNKAKEFVKKNYPEITGFKVIRDDDFFLTIGCRQIIFKPKNIPTKTFLIIINKLK